MTDDAPEGGACYWQHVNTCPGARKVGGGNWRLFKNLTDPRSQFKAGKSLDVGVYTGVLHLAPGNISGSEMCPWRTAGCTKACLGVSTPRVSNFATIQPARIRRTREFMDERPGFMDDLSRDVAAVLKKAAREGMAPAVRLNGTSDQPWESIPVTVDGVEYRSLMDAYNGEPGHGARVQFYDYTKSPARALRSVGQWPGSDRWPENYHLTYSYSEAPDSLETAEKVLAAGGNVAAVFRHNIPETWHGYPVTDATEHDARFLDPPGTISGLRALGTATKDTSGFVLDAPLDGEGGEGRRRGRVALRDRDRGRSERHMAVL